MEAIKDTLKNVMQALETKKKGLSQYDPQILLEQVLTKKELRHIKSHYFKRGTLSLDIDSSTWLYQLSLKKEGLLTELGKKNSSIRDIRFRLGG